MSDFVTPSSYRGFNIGASTYTDEYDMFVRYNPWAHDEKGISLGTYHFFNAAEEAFEAMRKKVDNHLDKNGLEIIVKENGIIEFSFAGWHPDKESRESYRERVTAIFEAELDALLGGKT